MRKLIEDIVYKNFKYGLSEMSRLDRGSELDKYLEPMNDMDWQERKQWASNSRLKEIKRLIEQLSDKQLLDCLTEQHCEQFR